MSAMKHRARLYALQIAALADCDPRSAAKALREGAAAVRGRAGERIAEIAAERGISLPLTDSVPPPMREVG